MPSDGDWKEGPRGAKALLPLKPDVFLILTILAEEPRHGYGIMRAAEDRPEGGVEIQAGALYRRLKWMMDEGLIEEIEDPIGGSAGSERKRTYSVTAFGRTVARAEARRMDGLLSAAREAHLLPGVEGG